MVYEEYTPPGSLRAAIASFWRFELEARDPDVVEHAIPPDGGVSLAVGWSERGVERVVVVGPRLSALRVPARREVRYVGVRTTPGGAGALLGLPARALRDRVAPLEELARPRAMELAGALADVADPSELLDRLARTVAAWVARTPALDPAVAAMVRRVLSARGQLRVSAVAEGTGLGYRQALRRFVEAVGLSPKELARLARLRQACLAALGAEAPTWAAVSASAGYSDQAHLTREFSEVFGWPPGLVREYLRRIEHIHVR